MDIDLLQLLRVGYVVDFATNWSLVQKGPTVCVCVCYNCVWTRNLSLGPMWAVAPSENEVDVWKSQ
jgi:hypothetical protein